MPNRENSSLGDIGEIIGTAIAIIILAILVYLFYTIPSPIQSYFQSIINEILIGFAIVGAIGLALLILKLLDFF